MDYQSLLCEYPDTAMVISPDAFIQLGAMFEETGVERVAVFCGVRGAMDSGAWKSLLTKTRVHHVNFNPFHGVAAGPSAAEIAPMVEFLAESRPDAVLALGGGSVMDAAKCAYLVYQAGGDVSDYYGLGQYSSRHPDVELERVVCVPTAAGSGAEATPFASLAAPGRKELVSNSQITPRFAFLFPEFTVTCPPRLTLAGGLDALTHAVEGYLDSGAADSHPSVGLWAETAIRLVFENLPKALANGGDLDARAALLVAGSLGGMVIRYRRTSLPHACGFCLEEHLEHGLAVAAVLPYAWNHYLSNAETAERTRELAAAFGLKAGANPAAVVAACRDFMLANGAPASLGKIKGLTKGGLAAVGESALGYAAKIAAAPASIPEKERKKILAEILEMAWKGAGIK